MLYGLMKHGIDWRVGRGDIKKVDDGGVRLRCEGKSL